MNQAKILIVEDEAIIAMEIESQMQSLGYEVTSIVDTGNKAIKKAEVDKPDLILMDIRIKGEMDGIETAEIIKNKFGIPVIFSTAYLDKERIKRAKITMPFGYVLKPIQERDLEVTIEMALYVARIEAERKEAEKALYISEHQYRTTLESIVDMIHVVDEELNLVFANEQFKGEIAALGIGIDFIGKNLFELVPLLSESVKKQYKQVFRSGKPLITGDSVDLNGGIRYTETRKIPVFEDNCVKRIITIIRDVTDKKRNEEQLTEEKEKFQNLYERAPLSYQSLDENGCFINVNNEWLDALGYTKEEVIGKSFGDFIHPEWAEHFKENFSRFKSMGEILGVEFNMMKKDGSLVYVSFNGKIGYDSEGKFKQTHCIWKDITIEKNLEEKLRESEIKYRKLFEDSMDGYALADPETGIITECNSAMADLVGRRKEELIGQHQRTLHPSSKHYSDFSSTFKKHTGENSGEILNAQLITKTGEIKDVNIRARVFEVSNKKVMHGIFRIKEKSE